MKTPGGGRLFSQYAVAEKLGKTLDEIKSMPEAEFAGWLTFFEVKNEFEKERIDASRKK